MSDSLITGEGESGGEGGVMETPPASADFSLYKDGGIHPDLEAYFDESNKAARGYMEAHKNSENPTKDFLNSISDLRKIASQKERTRPGEDATDDERQKWNDYLRSQLGVPEKAEGYGWQKPEGVDESMWDQAQVDTFAEILHKGNVAPETAKELFEAYNESLMSAPEQIEAQVAQQLQVEREKLNAEFGMDADKMIKQATEAANLWGVPQEEIERIGQTAEGVKLLSRLKNAVTSDVTSNTQSYGAINNNTSNYEEMARDASMKAIEAHNRGDMANYKKFVEQQSHYNQLHINSVR
jgi:hypothetical protein